MTRTLLLAVTVAAIGCGGSGSNNNNGGGNQAATCSASLKPSTTKYVVNGSVLRITDGNGNTSDLQRLGGAGGARPVFGMWKLPVNQAPPLVLNATMQISASRVEVSSACALPGGRTATVAAGAAATITDDTINILGSDSQVKTFSEELEDWEE